MGRDGDRIGITVDRAVVDQEFERVAAGVIDAEGRGRAGWVIEAGRTVRRFAQKTPAEGQWVVVHVAGAAAIELDQVGHEHGLVGTGVGNRLGVLGGYSDGIGIAGVQAVADRKLDFIRSGLIDEEAGIDGGRRVEAGTTAAGQAEHGPLIRQRIAIGVAGTTPVELDGVGDKDGLVWAGMGERLGVEGLDKDGIRVARFTAIGDDELEFVGADQVGGEAWGGRGWVAQGRCAADWDTDKTPLKAERISVGIG